MNVQHVKMPHKMGIVEEKHTLQPVDKLVYVYMRKYADKEGKTHISLERLSKECNLNRRTVASSITRLIKCQELTLMAQSDGKGKAREYKFNLQSKNFEMFSFECLKELQAIEDGKPKYSTSEKCVIIGLHELEFNRKEYGFVTYKLMELAEKINMSLPTLKRTIKSLEDKGVMETKKQDGQLIRKVDYTKIFQDILYTKEKVEEHENKINGIVQLMWKQYNGIPLSDEDKELLAKLAEQSQLIDNQILEE